MKDNKKELPKEKVRISPKKRIQGMGPAFAFKTNQEENELSKQKECEKRD